MTRALPLLALLTACAGMEETVRTERGPLLRTFERPRIVEGGVRGKVTVQWPKLTLALEGFDTCRTEVVEEYAEDKIRERRGTGAGASISAGVVFTVAAGVVLAVGQALSPEPNRERLDGAGNFGPPPRSIARGWSLTLFILGLPALAVGIVQLLRTGEEIETVKVEQIANQRDQTCNVRAADGPVWVRADSGATAGPLPTAAGTLTLDAASLKADVGAFVFYEHEVALDDVSQNLIEAFNGCLKLQRESAASLDAVATGMLLRRLEAARACRVVRGDEVAAEQGRLEAEVQRRRAGGEAGTFMPGAKRLSSFEDAVSAYPPRFTLEEGSADLSRTDVELTSQTVLARGRVQQGLSPNIGVVKVGPKELFVFVPHDAPWASDDFPLGTAVELVGIVAGPQTVADRTAPLVKALWMRKVLPAQK